MTDLNKSINFWSPKEVSFTESVKGLSTSIFNSASKLKEKLKSNKEKIVEESEKKIQNDIDTIKSKRVELKDVKYDENAYKIPEIDQGTHSDMETAYKSSSAQKA